MALATTIFPALSASEKYASVIFVVRCKCKMFLLEHNRSEASRSSTATTTGQGKAGQGRSRRTRSDQGFEASPTKAEETRGGMTVHAADLTLKSAVAFCCDGNCSSPRTAPSPRR